MPDFPLERVYILIRTPFKLILNNHVLQVKAVLRDIFFKFLAHEHYQQHNKSPLLSPLPSPFLSLPLTVRCGPM